MKLAFSVQYHKLHQYLRYAILHRENIAMSSDPICDREELWVMPDTNWHHSRVTRQLDSEGWV